MKTVLITGAANGIGKATAEELHARGYRLALIDRDENALDAVKHFGSVAACDVTDGEALQAVVARLEGEFGGIDVLLACAGIGSLTIVPDMKIHELKRMLEVNLVGVALSIEAVMPGMIARKSGHIVGIASVAGFRGMPWMISYSASKAGLIAYLEAIRPGLKRRGIRVTTVCPGFVETAITRDTPFRDPVKMLTPQEAGKHLVRAIEKQPRDYIFPFSMKIGMLLLKKMPNWMFDSIMDKAGPRALTTEF